MAMAFSMLSTTVPITRPAYRSRATADRCVTAMATALSMVPTCSASSLDFFIYCSTRTAVWAEFHRVKQDVLLKILEIVENHGAEVAFPTTTVHVPDGIAALMQDADGEAAATSA